MFQSNVYPARSLQENSIWAMSFHLAFRNKTLFASQTFLMIYGITSHGLKHHWLSHLMCASVSVVRVVAGDLCGELRGTFILPCRVCTGAAAGCCVVWAQPCTECLWRASLSCSVSIDRQCEARNALAQSHCLERKTHPTALASKVSSLSFKIILHLRTLSESGLCTPIKKKYWDYSVCSCVWHHEINSPWTEKILKNMIVSLVSLSMDIMES